MHDPNAKQLLIVDDDIVDVLHLMDLLNHSSESVTTTHVKDGEEGLQLLLEKLKEQTSLPALIFLDMKMPRMTGFEFLTELQEHQPLRSIPVILLSTSDHEREQIRTSDFNVLAYYAKDQLDAQQIEKALNLC